MADPSSGSKSSPTDGRLIDRLRAFPLLSQIPEEELQWLVEHGTIDHRPIGEVVVEKGESVPGLYVILRGRLTHLLHRGGVWRKTMEWSEGEVTGVLPYSRMAAAVGRSVATDALEALTVPREDVPLMPSECPALTEVLVHLMIDRAREFKSSDLQLEKLASLGRLAAGMAHELNNPASAAARSARLLTEAFAESDAASQALGAAGFTAEERETLERLRSNCLATPTSQVRSPLELADREDALSDWLADQGADQSCAHTLAETEVTLEGLGELAGSLAGEKLDTALRWVAAACTVHSLARDVEQASSRVHDLVRAVKGFTYMDTGAAREPVDVGRGLTDTVAVLASKASGKKVALTVDVAADLARVHGLGGELNQVWSNLIDNGLDAVEEGGRVTVTAANDGGSVVVRVIDDGPGIPAEVADRIFDPFFTTKTVGSGTGLGLDIAHRLVTRHEGWIDVTSVPGRTEFSVTLPGAG